MPVECNRKLIISLDTNNLRESQQNDNVRYNHVHQWILKQDNTSVNHEVVLLTAAGSRGWFHFEEHIDNDKAGDMGRLNELLSTTNDKTAREPRDGDRPIT